MVCPGSCRGRSGAKGNPGSAPEAAACAGMPAEVPRRSLGSRWRIPFLKFFWAGTTTKIGLRFHSIGSIAHQGLSGGPPALKKDRLFCLIISVQIVTEGCYATFRPPIAVLITTGHAHDPGFVSANTEQFQPQKRLGVLPRLAVDSALRRHRRHRRSRCRALQLPHPARHASFPGLDGRLPAAPAAGGAASSSAHPDALQPLGSAHPAGLRRNPERVDRLHLRPRSRRARNGCGDQGLPRGCRW